jgi:hypothetical protein
MKTYTILINGHPYIVKADTLTEAYNVAYRIASVSVATCELYGSLHPAFLKDFLARRVQ